MRLNQFDLNLLVALDALLHEKSVTRAARKVFISQPALSAALRTLREHFDDPLLVRIGRQLELTPRGRLLIEPVRQARQFAQAAICFNDAFDPAAIQLASRLAPFNELRLLPLPFEVPNSREVLLWHRRLNADPAHVWLRMRCIDVARQCAA
jgi:LysR family transcriptional regulator, nod-box dependent transcriptional activator